MLLEVKVVKKVFFCTLDCWDEDLAINTTTGMTNAFGLNCCCYCLKINPERCTNISTCPAPFTCDSDGLFTEGCPKSSECVSPACCCEGDFSSSATSAVIPAGLRDVLSPDPAERSQLDTPSLAAVSSSK
ncbi:uncharacterized protein LOC115049012 isoform X2 [Echeneis naucrates]|uniref:uncharacterized protein LOC115049012 isoform X2 n=1 Tax=Echeneis naucrates TaxID=173247 RepID=UPI001113D7CD|nr:uncharacterized protein LOC115049012 isoform X2 [Echeneis naucrates]